MSLYEQLIAPEPSAAVRVRDLSVRLPLMVLDPLRDEVASLLLSQVQEAVALAQANIAEAQASGKLGAMPEADAVEARQFEQSMDRVASSGARSQRWLDDAVDGRCVHVERDAKEFWKSFDAHLGRYGNVTSRSLREAFELLRGGLRAQGTDRDVALQDAQGRFRELSTEEEGALSPYVWLALGWLHARSSAGLEAAEQAFFKGILLRNSPSPVVEILLSRHLADAHSRRKSHSAALSAIQKAVGVRGDPESHLDAARYGALADRSAEVRRHLDPALAADPLACVDALAAPELLDVADAVLRSVVEAQRRLRANLESVRSAHEGSFERVRQAVGRAGLAGQLAIGLIDAVSTKPAGLFEVVAAQHDLDERRSDVVATVSKAIESAMKEKRQRVDAAQRQLDDAWNEREAATNEAASAHQALADAARSRASEGLPDAARLQQGCMWSLAVGCGGMAVYGVLAALLGGAGVAIGPETLVGKFAIGLALAPLAFAAILQIVVASKQSALQSEMWRDIERSRAAMEAANQKVDTAYRARLPKLRDELAEAQAELKRLEEALEMLG